MENSPEQAAALKLQQDGQEMAALLIDNLATASAREGLGLQPADFARLIPPMLSATWFIARQALPGDEAGARRMYVDLLRRHADGVEGLG